MDIPTGFLPMLAPRLSPPTSAARWRVTALGGGHGLSASLQALRSLDAELTAVVTVADDGGSSGTLRQEFGVLPPGDLRMALAALCDDTEWGRTWADVMQHRFTTLPDSPGTMDQHALGNLLIVALWEMMGDPVDGLRWAGSLLGARGTVLPMSLAPLTIHGNVLTQLDGGGLSTRRIVGQSALAIAAQAGTVSDVTLEPEDAAGTPQALAALEAADWNILGPGSWYTSVLPHLLLPDVRRALEDSPARTLVTMNLQTHTTETNGMDAAAHLDLLGRYAPGLVIDAVLADPSSVEDESRFRAAAERLGARVFFDRVSVRSGEPVHDQLRLAAAYRDVFETFETTGS
ncbi:gluconeogenesis factor YvcK family protein [Galactobacter caseinivorans]|uniref:Putative gluconeogenesis factor n=1 Tax=Galactobacter caseinivorans TaxID=2676123 RepID=A0A496PKK6_9MICC|nr:uridine diphosphate-N-acetylglucosamine-binding protein YvcK [Galactobacter caseinivorans]RKW71059.1 uridine diphosphate-N-acetylglucosamine-binding protein YvcK [Galactobacter caseinivorans]